MIMESQCTMDPSQFGPFAPLQSRNFSVRVTPQEQHGWCFRYNGLSTELKIDVCAGHLCVIQFKLEEGSGRFMMSPISWVDPASGSLDPIPTPPELSVVRHADDHISIIDLDTGDKKKDFHFVILVEINGNVATSRDPTIINHPDPPPGP